MNLAPIMRLLAYPLCFCVIDTRYSLVNADNYMFYFLLRDKVKVSAEKLGHKYDKLVCFSNQKNKAAPIISA